MNDSPSPDSHHIVGTVFFSPGLDGVLVLQVHLADLESFAVITHFIYLLFCFFFSLPLLGDPGENNLATQRKKSPFLRSKSKDKDKSPTAHPAFSKRLRFWSSSDIPPSPNESVSFSEIGDF